MSLIKDYIACVILLTLVLIAQADPTVALQTQLIQLYSANSIWIASVVLLTLGRVIDMSFGSRGHRGFTTNAIVTKLSNSQKEFGP